MTRPFFRLKALSRLAPAVLAAALLAGCASSEGPAVAADEINDPFEPVNRAVFTFNEGLDTLALKPAATGYRLFVPPEVRGGVDNALTNLKSPVVLANDMFQGNGERAFNTFMRFLINSTIGVLGVFDVADRWGYTVHDEDFGQTLAVWGMREGPYLMLPLLGPSNPRDAIGFVVDYFLDPFRYVYLNTDEEYLGTVQTGTRAVNAREQQLETIDEIKKSSLDYYAAVRSLYRQRRNSEIANGQAAADPFALEIGDPEPSTAAP